MTLEGHPDPGTWPGLQTNRHHCPGHQPWLVPMALAMGSCPLPASLTREGLDSLRPFPCGLVPCPAQGQLAQSLRGAVRVAQGDRVAQSDQAAPLPLLSPGALLSGTNPLALNPSCPHPSGQLYF